MANQANLENVPSQKLVELEAEFKKIDDGNKVLAGEVKSLGAGAYTRSHQTFKFSVAAAIVLI